MGLFKKALGVLAAPATGGLSLLGGGGGLKDTLFGKKDEGTADRIIGLDPSLARVVGKARGGQAEAASLFRDELKRLKDVDPLKIANRQRSIMEKQALGASEDMRRRASQEIAKRGLGRSSVGFNALLNADNKIRENLMDYRANRPLMEQQARAGRIGQIGQVSGGLNQILSAPGAQRGFIAGRQGTGQRSGGLANLALSAGGAALGGAMGGPQGAGAGMQIGGGIGNMLGGMF